MNCAELQEMFVQYHLDELDDASAHAIDAHLACGCDACNAEMSAILDGIDLFYDVAPDSAVSQSLLGHIRAAAKTMQTSSANLQTARPQAARSAASLETVVIASVSLLGSLAAGLLLMMYLAPLENLDPPQASQTQDFPAGRMRLERKHALEGIEQVPPDLRLAQAQFRRTQFVSLRAPSASVDFRGTIVWDPLGSEIHFFGYDFAVPPANHDYVLWIGGPDGKPYPAKTLVLDADNDSTAIVRIPGRFSATAFVTVEPSGEATDF